MSQPPSGPAVPEPSPGTLVLSDALRHAWTAFTSNIGALVILALVVVGIQAGLTLVRQVLQTGAEADSAIIAGTFALLSLGFSILAWVIGLMLAIGLIRAALAIMDGRTPTPSLLVATEGLASYILAAVLFSLATAVGVLACLLPGLVIAFCWQFYGYAIVDGRGSVGATESLRRSFGVVKAHVGELLVLWLAFLGIGLIAGIAVVTVSALTPILGTVVSAAVALVVYPVIALTLAYSWRRLSGGVVAPV
jgi:hypothetical protein